MSVGSTVSLPAAPSTWPATRRLLLVLIGLLLLGSMFGTLLAGNLNQPIRWFNDYYDRLVYWRIGAWLPGSQVPYVEVASEYPPAATYLFGLVRLPLGSTPSSQGPFMVAFSLLMLAALGITWHLTHAMLPAGRKRWAWLLLLPSCVYFAWNRYDILPSLVVLISLRTLGQGHPARSGCLLALGAMLKWYPALLLPIYFQFFWASGRRQAAALLLAFALTLVGLSLPIVLAGGLHALWAPYSFHLGRGLEPGSLLFAVTQAWPTVLGPAPSSQLPLVGLVLQVGLAPLALISRIRTLEHVARWALVTIAAFMIFGRYYSPQWLLWLMPLLILTAQSGFDLWLIVVLNVATYIAFPLLYDAYLPAGPFALAGVLIAALIIALSVRRWPGPGVGERLFARLPLTTPLKEN